DKDTNTITLPQNMVRLINISIMDRHGNLQPIAYNPNINTLDIRCSTKTCSCGCGGKGTYCSEADNIQATTEVVTIDGTDYNKITYTKYDGAGNMYRLIEMPTWDVQTNAVVTTELRELICALDVTSTGCIKVTEPNRVKLVQSCGCYIPPNIYGEGPNCGPKCNIGYEEVRCEDNVLVPPIWSDYGYYNWDAQKGDVIHLKHVKADQIIVAYQNNGQITQEECLVPEYAVEAMLLGIYWRQRFVAPQSVCSYPEKKAASIEYDNAKIRLFEFKNPMRMDAFINAQTIRTTW
ncbi:MAG TPA: hypothetical protein VFS31_14405, partial [Chitinophagaceae bacterium]|nr:hypothetical protein [Chitinophagaceae bacterium]